jgi:RNA polymerase sigma-70 factor, ECF subfamily
VVLLAGQDRSRWDSQLIGEGCSLLRAALRRGPPGKYALQAAIAAVHCQARRAEDTDWRQITALYERLLLLDRSPVIALNHATAASMCEGPAAALPLVDALESELSGCHLWHATRADVLRRLQRYQEALLSYQRAHALAEHDAERRFIRRRMAELEERS